MNILSVPAISLVIAAGLSLYLLIALLKPEWFS